MRKRLRACVTVGVPVIATAAIVFGPLGMSPDNDVVIPHRTIDIDPTSLDSKIAELYRAITESGAHLEAAAPPAPQTDTTDPLLPGTPKTLRPSLEDALDGTAGRDEHPTATWPRTATEDAQRDDAHRRRGDKPSRPATPDATEDTAAGTGGDPSAPDAGDSWATPADPGTPDGTGSADLGTPPPPNREALAPSVSDPADPGADTPTSAGAKREALGSTTDGAAATEQESDSTPANEPKNRKPLSAGSIREKTKTTLRDIERGVRKAVEGLRPQRKAKSDSGE